VWLAGLPTAAPAPALPPAAASPAGGEAGSTPDAPAGTLGGSLDGGSRKGGAPVRVRLAGIDIDAPVVPVGVDDRGRMAVPLNVATVGWYHFGPGPGATSGSVVLSGHVDDREQGLGAFHRLADLAAGDPVTVARDDGTVLGYRVRTIERVGKADLPLAQVFARDGPPRLTLVTCGGAFDRSAGVYTQNVIVTAEPANGP
jgi:LPXTG-site transpeptidase (sortase) family protein